MNVRPRRRSVEIAASFRPTRIVIVLAIVAAYLPAAWAEPSPSEVLTAVGFPENAQQRILAGELVTSNLKAVSERDLSIAMGFLVKGRAISRRRLSSSFRRCWCRAEQRKAAATL